MVLWVIIAGRDTAERGLTVPVDLRNVPAGLEITVEELISMGHHLKTYIDIVKEHQVDLLVLNTKDEDQLAMHGLAYPLAVDLRQIPLLML